MAFEFMTPQELAAELGSRLRNIRIRKMLDQKELAARAGISTRTLIMLEQGRGSTVETFLRVLKALDSLAGIDALAPRPTISPIAMMRVGKLPQRVIKKRPKA
jgi:transcriptional regulator with XRE-family HTH domain